MAIFRYQALNSAREYVAGEQEADSVQQAIAQLEASGLSVQAISYATPDAPMKSTAASGADRPAADETISDVFARSGSSIEQTVLRSHMAQILERGRAIAPALRAYADEMPFGRRKRRLGTVCSVLERGDASAATSELVALPDYWIPLLSAATASPDPGRVLHEFLIESERADNLRRQRWQVLAYPFLVGCLALAVMTFLSVYVIPIFRGIFKEFDLELPELTLFVLRVAFVLASPWLLAVVVFVLASGVFLLNAKRILPSSASAWLGDRFSTPSGRRTAIARFAQFTADLLEAGLTTPDALRIAAFTVNRTRLRRAAWREANDMDSGGNDAPQSGRTPLTATVAHVVRSDMPTSAQIHLLKEISACHAERARRGLSWTAGIIEPLAICLVALVVAITVLALFMPLIKLIEGLSK